MKTLNPNLIQLVALLNDQQHHSSTELAEQLGIASTTVQQLIKQLIAYNILIENTQNQNYRMSTPLVLLDPEYIKPLLVSKDIPLEVLETVDSTNRYLKTLPPCPVAACLAETQTTGQGRLQRRWHSPFGQNIYLSLRYALEKNSQELSGLACVVSLAVSKAIATHCILPIPLQIKWPNDIICNNKKLAGILIEICAATKTSCTVVIGIGINVNMLPTATTTIDQPWTSLYAEQQQPYNRNELSAAIINITHDYLKRFCTQGLTEFLPEWHTQDYLFDQDISLQSNGAEFHGTGAGINTAGQLLLTLADGTTHTFAAGEITAKMR